MSEDKPHTSSGSLSGSYGHQASAIPHSLPALTSPDTPKKQSHTLGGSMQGRIYRQPYRSFVSAPPPWKLLVRMPTRSRPEQALSVAQKYIKMAGCPVTLEIVADHDDESMAHAAAGFFSLGKDARLTTGDHKNKVEAVNGGNFIGWDVMILASDDMVPVCEGYGARVLSAMAEHFPYLDGALHFNDGYVGRALCTLPIFGRRLYDQFGYVYFPGYQSFFCDNEQTEVLSQISRLAYVDETIIEHRHPANHGKAPVDDLYLRNNAAWKHDEDLYRARKARNFDAPVMVLSILVASLPRRAALLRILLDSLWGQAIRRPRQVEILVDTGEGTTGRKRQQLLSKARGQYVAFVDDDDLVAPDYIQEIFAALERTPNADCVEMHVSINDHEHGHCSIQYDEWNQLGSTYVRCPNHLSPVKRSIALQAGFPDKTVGEDYEYSMRLRPLLRTEAKLASGSPLYLYYPGRGE